MHHRSIPRADGHALRRRAIVVGAGAGALLAATHVRGASYPTRTITMVVPFPPGGGFDAIGRPFAEKLGRVLGQTVIVDNRPGGGGNLGADYVTRANADGYTLLFGNDFLATNPNVSKNVRYDPQKDFAMIALVGSTQVVIAVRPDFPARNWAELVALSQAKALTFGTPGVGTSPHLIGEYLSFKTPLKTLHVPYKGTGPAVTDTIGGQIDMVFATMPSVASFIRAGKMRGIAIIGDRRSAQVPDVPTLRESGGPQIDYDVWYCLAAPAATPPDVLAALRSATRTALDAELAEALAKQGYDGRPGPPEEMSRILQRDLARWREVVDRAKITID